MIVICWRSTREHTATITFKAITGFKPSSKKKNKYNSRMLMRLLSYQYINCCCCYCFFFFIIITATTRVASSQHSKVTEKEKMTRKNSLLKKEKSIMLQLMLLPQEWKYTRKLWQTGKYIIWYLVARFYVIISLSWYLFYVLCSIIKLLHFIIIIIL